VPRPKKSLEPPKWWVERWLDSVARESEPSRRQRGRGYARAGRVEDLILEPGLLAARVWGSRPAPYRVEVRVPTFDEPLWRRATARLAEQAGTTAALLVGELPESAEAAFAALGASLFPGVEERVAISCSCPDWQRPCKHAMALFHLIAARLATDPFVLFTLRGRSRDELLAGLRAIRTASVRTAAEGEESEAVSSPADELAEAVDGFWSLPPPGPSAAAPPSPPAARRLPPPPAALGGALLRQELATAYAVMKERAGRLGRAGA
jgi:uncharacterized Zn finger protein